MGPFGEGWTEADVEAVLARGDPEELAYAPDCPLDGLTLEELEAAAERDAAAWLRAADEAYRPARP